MDPILGSITLFAGNFAPRGWAFCNGQTVAISQNSALFSLLGAEFGGDGITTFCLPDLRGRVPMHAGTGAGLTPRAVGEKIGTETVRLLSEEMPPHSHDLLVANVAADNDHATGDMLSRSQIYTATATPLVPLNPLSISISGGSQPHDNIQPSLCINYIIAMEGIYPSRP